MWKIFLPLLLVALSPIIRSKGVQEVEVDVPLSGWHPVGGGDISSSQSINYLTSSVSMADNQNILAQVHDKVKSYASASKIQQGRPVVNGTGMPQRIESDGSFTRPCISARGSNSAQVIGPDGQSRQKMQFYSMPDTGVIRTRLQSVLSWDTDDTDFDLRVVTSDDEHAWYSNTTLKNSGILGVDVMTGYGPEIFAMPASIHGCYQVCTNYYGGRSKTELTTAQLTLVTDEGSINKKQETLTTPMCNVGELMLVKGFDW